MHKLPHKLPHKLAQTAAHTHYPYKGGVCCVQCVHLMKPEDVNP
jgi:hypothetical protein